MSASKRPSLTSQGSVFGSPTLHYRKIVPPRQSVSSHGSLSGSPVAMPKFMSARPSVSSQGSINMDSPKFQPKSMNMITRPSTSSAGGSVFSSICSSVEDLSASMDDLDLLCVDNVQSEDEIQTVLYRLLMDMEKLKKKVHYFKKNYAKLDKKNEILERQNNVLHGQIVKYQCDTDRVCKENERLKEKLRKLQDSRLRDVRQLQIHDVQPCAIVSEDYVYV